MKEVWKVVKGYEGRYEVSTLGNVKSMSNGANLKPSVNHKILLNKQIFYKDRFLCTKNNFIFVRQI